MNNRSSFFAELKRRNVYKVAVAYAVVGWLIAQIATQIFPFLEIPNWAIRLVILLIVIGFPIALVIAWAFEPTPEGIKRTEDADAMPTRAAQKKHAWIYVVVVGAVALDRFVLSRSLTPQGIIQRLERAEPVAGSSIPQKSIAVLPFENLSDDKGAAYFADGIQDEILTKLASIADLKVISRTSTAKYKSKPEDLKTVSQQLGVATVLEGSVQKAADKVRVNVQLIDARADSHLWAKTYDRDMKDVFAVESEVAQEIADSLQAKLRRPKLTRWRARRQKTRRLMIFSSKGSSNSVSPTAISGPNHSTRQRAGIRKRLRATRISPWPSRNWLCAGCGVIG